VSLALCTPTSIMPAEDNGSTRVQNWYEEGSEGIAYGRAENDPGHSRRRARLARAEGRRTRVGHYPTRKGAEAVWYKLARKRAVERMRFVWKNHESKCAFRQLSVTFGSDLRHLRAAGAICAGVSKAIRICDRHIEFDASVLLPWPRPAEGSSISEPGTFDREYDFDYPAGHGSADIGVEAS